MKRRTAITVLTAGFASLLSVSLTLFSPQLAAQNLEEVTFLLPAPEAQVAFAPWMLARSRGYYAAEGLKVTFQPPPVDPCQSGYMNSKQQCLTRFVQKSFQHHTLQS
jgi:ABC-type nitrate/sulfonate/bicarbonate transport system substrate-binding protein